MSLINCSECEKEISDHARWCPHCGFARSASQPMRTYVTDIDMSFFNMMGFMIKWAFAAIPAIIILAILFAMASGVLYGLVLRH